MTTIDLGELASRFTGRVLTDSVDMAPFLVDWRKLWHGHARAVVQPDTARDVAAIVRWCAEHGIPIVPQGGNTGMSGGATPDASGNAIVLSLARLNQIRQLDTLNNTISLNAGCILATVQAAADSADRLFPLSLGAEGSCTIGGNLATNAGGTGVLRYGNARELCLGLEVVTAQGEIWDGMRGLRKDNSGYDLRDLLIGSEGTLGIITGAVMKLFPKPVARLTAFAGLSSVEGALALLNRLRARFDSQLTAFEVLSDPCLKLVEDHVSGTRSPLASRSSWYGVVELSVSHDGDEKQALLEEVLVAAIADGIVSDVALANSLTQRDVFWRLRESISEAQGAIGKAIKHDIALPLSGLAGFLAEADALVAARWPEMEFVTFGHLGDGNLHYNFSPRRGADQEAFLDQQDALNQLVHDIVARHGGTFSAEHGLGQLRRDEALRLKSPIEMGLMRSIKHALDPRSILNPGKLLS